MKHQAYSGKILKSIVFYSVLQLIILRVHLNLRFFRDSVEKKKKDFLASQSRLKHSSLSLGSSCTSHENIYK